MIRPVITCCLLLSSALAGPSLQGGIEQPASGNGPPHIAPYRPALDSGTIPPFDAALSDAARPVPLSTWRQSPADTAALTAGNYYITSPNYPASYPNNFSFTYPTFTGDRGQQLRIHCPHFDVEAQRTCSYDWLSINGSHFCGQAGIAERRALSLSIQFHTDAIVTGAGFVCYIDVPAESCCGRVTRRGRIVGGVASEHHEYPWQAGVVNAGSNRTWCGGSLISSRYVLTAAHCTAGVTAQKIEVLLGDVWIGRPDDGELRFSVASIAVHPGYTTYTAGNDFSLLRLASVVPISGDMSPVCLPPADQMFAGQLATATGFGRTASEQKQSEVLREVQLPVWSVSECAALLASFNTSTMVCAGGEAGQATCNGDSGGPLVVQLDGSSVLVGVTSFGYVPCGVDGHPSVYGRVSAVLDWIEESTRDASLCG